MARPVLKTGSRGNRQVVWETIRAQVAPWTDRDIVLSRAVVAARIDVDTVREYRRALLAAGIVRVVTKAPKFSASTYELVVDEGLNHPRLRQDGSRVTQGLGNEQMWRALRVLPGDISAPELAITSSTTAVTVVASTARAYLGWLHRAGYVEQTVAGHGVGAGGISARYRLRPEKNTGPRPPMITAVRAVYDSNLEAIVWQEPVDEESCIYGK